MKLGCFSQIATLTTAIAVGLGYFSFWWMLIPAFLTGSLSISNGPGFDIVMRANQEGRLSVFPMMIVAHILPWLALSGVIYWVTTALSSN